jgi:CDP-paratose synthetase
LSSAKTILITGINGFLGSSLAKKLKERYNVIGLEYTLNNLSRIEGLGLQVYAAKNGVPEELFSDNKIDIVLHTATFYGREKESLNKILSANMIVPFDILDRAIASGCKLFVNTDTVLERYTSSYALTKRHFHEWLYFRRNEIKVVNMQLEHFYGFAAPDTNFITGMIKRLLKNEPEIQLTKGEQIRDFVHVDDVVAAFLKIFEKADQITDAFSTFQVASGEVISIRDLLSFLKEITGSTSNLNFGAFPYRDNEMMASISSNHALIALGWAPMISIRQGLQQMVNSMKSELQ